MDSQYDVPDNEFIASPIGSGARVARGYRWRLQNEGIILLDACERTLGIDLADLRASVAGWDIERKWSPAPYAYVHNLKQAVKSGRLDPVFESLMELRLLTDEALYDADFRITSILTERWEREFVKELRSNPSRSESGESIIVRPLLSEPPGHVIDALRRAIQTIRDFDPLIAEEWDAYITRIKLFVGRSAIGVSAPRVMGAMYLKIPASIDPYSEDLHSYFVNQLVHEAGHAHLFQLQSQDYLLLEDGEAIHAAPIRKDPRPMLGVLHATFVLSRTIRIHEKYLAANADDPHVAFILKESYDQIETGFRSCEGAARFTPLGRQFFDSIRACYVGAQRA